MGSLCECIECPVIIRPRPGPSAEGDLEATEDKLGDDLDLEGDGEEAAAEERGLGPWPDAAARELLREC